MKLGLIGPGRHGSRYLQEQNGGRYFTRVLSRKPRTDLPDWVTGTIDPEEFFAPGLDGVVIATPTETHFELALEALERGLHVLCEKPLCETAEHCATIIDLAEMQRLRLLVAHTDLFHSEFPRSAIGVPVVSHFSGPGETSEWAPHAVATTVFIACTEDQISASHVIVEGNTSVKRRRVTWASGKFDGTMPSDPTPLATMIQTFVGHDKDRRMSYDFTRAVYRVLLTES